MTRSQFLCLIDEMIEAAPGTAREDHSLADLEGWDSLAAVSFVAEVNARLGLTLSAKRLTEASTVRDLIRLVDGSLED